MRAYQRVGGREAHPLQVSNTEGLCLGGPEDRLDVKDDSIWINNMGCCCWCQKVTAFGAEAAEATKAKAKEKEKHKAATTPATVPQVQHHGQACLT